MPLNHSRTLVWAHRGASAYAPENTLEAFSLAIDMKADGIELDVYLTADGTLAVHHDPTPERTTCGACRDVILTSDFEKLRKFDYNCGREGFSGVRIPTLSEVYALMEPSGLTVNVELKAGGAGFCSAVLDCAEKAGMRERVIYSSFDHFLLGELLALDNTAKVAPLYSFNMLLPWKYGESFGAAALHPHLMQVYALADYVTEAHKRGICVNPWTIDDEDNMKRLIALDCDALITNRPDIARAVLGLK